MSIIITILIFLAVALAGSHSNQGKVQAPATEAPLETAEN